MNSYIVALCLGGTMEQPEITYQYYQSIVAPNKEAAVDMYNRANGCNYFYGSAMCAVEEGDFKIFNKDLTLKQVEHYQKDLLTDETH